MSIESQQRRILTIANAPPGVQAWVDAFIEAARVGAPGNWPHGHPSMPQLTISLETLWQRIEENFPSQQGHWSVVSSGFPPPVSSASAHKHDDPDPNQGSAYHNLLHSIYGDFH